MERSTIAVAIAGARVKARLTQRQAAKELEISQGYLAGIEVGRNDPDAWQLLIKMAELYKVSVDQLLGLFAIDGEKVKETNDVLSRLSPARYNEVLHIARCFLLHDSQDYREEVIEDLIASSEIFGGDRVLEFLIAIKNSSHTLNSQPVDSLALTDQPDLNGAIQ